MAVTRLLRRADSSRAARTRVAVAAGEVSDALRSILSRFCIHLSQNEDSIKANLRAAVLLVVQQN